jgi:TetR/AcrR family transcriptional regulator, transcriptional repressor for nem operon
MPRHKEFDREKALRAAIAAFSRSGFSATSTDDLMAAMNLGRQSMYDTFGDKRALFLKALRLYSEENINAIVAELRKPGRPLTNIRNVLIQFTERKDLSPPYGCMGVNAICEFGLTDQEVLEAMQDAARLQRRVLLETLRRAIKQGELAPDADIAGLAEYVEVTLAGLRVAAKGGMGRAALKRIVEIATSVFQQTTRVAF